MLYRPRLANGALVPIEWPLRLYRCLNIVCWPLEDNAGTAARLFDRSCWLLAFLAFVQHNDAELRYLLQTMQQLDEMLSGVPTYLVLLEVHFRAFQLGLRKTEFKRFLQKFYAQIYIEESRQPKLFRLIRRQMRPTIAVCIMYFVTLLLYLLVPILNVIYRRKDLLYKMIFPFDHTPLYLYVPVLASNVWVGVLVDTMILGEVMVVSNIILHLNARYTLLRADLELRIAALMRCSDGAHIAREFKREIIATIKQNVRLNRFAAEMQAEFSFRIFVWFAFSAALLCALSFKVYTNPIANTAYAFWMCGKILEMLAIGFVGSTIIFTTDQIGSMYYESQWEAVLLRSSDTRENVRMLKLVLLAIETNQKPFYLTGMNFFSVSLLSVVKILQGAGSYFTCLISFR